MIPKIRGLGFTFVVIMAMSMAASALAQASEFHAASGPNVSIFGEQTEQLTLSTDSGTTKCTQVLFEGTAPSSTSGTTTAQELTLTPTITGCTAFGLTSTVDMNGCEYTITGAGTPALTADFDIVCNKTAGKLIETTTLTCTVTTPAQTLSGHITFSNGPGNHVNANFTVNGMTYEGHGFCPGLTATTLTHNGTYTGQATFRARVDAGAAQATHNGHTYQKLLQTGAQVVLTAT